MQQTAIYNGYRAEKKYSHPLNSPSTQLCNIITGQVAAAEINTHQAVELGTDMRDGFIAAYPERFHNSISTKFKTMHNMKVTVKVNDKPVYDLDALFGRLLVVGPRRDIPVSELFQYELSPVPPSLINEYVSLGSLTSQSFYTGLELSSILFLLLMSC